MNKFEQAVIKKEKVAIQKESQSLEEVEHDLWHKRKNDQACQEKIKNTIDYKRIEKELSTSILKQKEVIDVLGRLTIELSDKIDDYNIILSDDASGRLISILFKKIIDKKRDENKKEKTKIYFLALRSLGQFPVKKGEYEKLLENLISEKIKKDDDVLVISEYIQTGGNLAPLADILDEKNINFDIAAVSCDSRIIYDNDKRERGINILKHLKFGEIGDIGEKYLYNRPFYTGVRKSKWGETSIYPKKARFQEDLMPLKHKFIAQARRDIQILAEELGALVDIPKDSWTKKTDVAK